MKRNKAYGFLCQENVYWLKSGITRCAATLLCLITVSASVCSQAANVKPRARDLGVPFDGSPGKFNAITDVSGVEVGHVTLVKGEGKLVRGKGPIRTGVTAIHPRGKGTTAPVFGAWFTLNAAGEMTGTTWLEERGLLEGPIMITNTHSVGVVRDAAVGWNVETNKEKVNWPGPWYAPIVAETYDGILNDIDGFHVKRKHALEALAKASSGAVEEGAVGGGTGMLCNGFKGGIGTASRVFSFDGKEYTVGVLVQCNYGSRKRLRIAGVPIDKNIVADRLCYSDKSLKPPVINLGYIKYCDEPAPSLGARTGDKPGRDGSIIIVVATDAPLLPHQLKRVAKRPSLAIGRLGGVSSNGSGDIFVAFSTADASSIDEKAVSRVNMFPNKKMTDVFKATVEATEESIVNAMVAAESMTGVNGVYAPALPHDELRRLMREKFAK